MVIPSQVRVKSRKGVETVWQVSNALDKETVQTIKPERGNESCSGTHNRLVAGSNPARPTNFDQIPRSIRGILVGRSSFISL